MFKFRKETNDRLDFLERLIARVSTFHSCSTCNVIMKKVAKSINGVAFCGRCAPPFDRISVGEKGKRLLFKDVEVDETGTPIALIELETALKTALKDLAELKQIREKLEKEKKDLEGEITALKAQPPQITS